MPKQAGAGQGRRGVVASLALPAGRLCGRVCWCVGVCVRVCVRVWVCKRVEGGGVDVRPVLGASQRRVRGCLAGLCAAVRCLRIHAPAVARLGSRLATSWSCLVNSLACVTCNMYSTRLTLVPAWFGTGNAGVPFFRARVVTCHRHIICVTPWPACVAHVRLLCRSPIVLMALLYAWLALLGARLVASMREGTRMSSMGMPPQRM